MEIPKNALITGVNRGLGLALVRAYLAKGYKVFGLFRNRTFVFNSEPNWAGQFYPIIANITEDGVITEIQRVLSLHTESLDILINNAGIRGYSRNIDGVTPAELNELINTHCLGALRCIKGALAFLQKSQGAAIVNITSRWGSISRNIAGEFAGKGFSYRIAKAAQNMLTICLSQDPRMQDMAVCSVHPGIFRSELGWRDAKVEPDEIAFKLIKWLDEAYEMSLDNINGKCFELGKGELEW